MKYPHCKFFINLTFNCSEMVAPALFLDISQMKKKTKLSWVDKQTFSQAHNSWWIQEFILPYHGCTWLHRIFWPEVGVTKNLHDSFIQTTVPKCENTERLTDLFHGYNVKPRKCSKQKQTEKELVLIKINIIW